MNALALELGGASLLGLLRLGSAALPIGAFAYSQGLERAVSTRVVHDAPSALAWLEGMIEHSLLSNDLPTLLRLYEAWQSGQLERVLYWNGLLYATRGSRELREEELQLGRALARLAADLGVERAEPFRRARPLTLACMYALVGVEWRTGANAAALAYGFAWAEAQVAAVTRLVPLGQTQAQRVLSHCISALAQGLPRAAALADDEISSSAAGQVLLSMQHETEYCRLFRS